jgi:hypothetical protein
MFQPAHDPPHPHSWRAFIVLAVPIFLTILSTGTAVYAMFRQLGATLGVAAWVATLGVGSLASAASYVPGWAFIW